MHTAKEKTLHQQRKRTRPFSATASTAHVGTIYGLAWPGLTPPPLHATPNIAALSSTVCRTFGKLKFGMRSAAGRPSKLTRRRELRARPA